MTTILVIDDDESLRDTIGIMLEQEGFSPILVADGKAGFERALSVKPDLMMVDLRLPGMSGTEICKQVRAANLKTPMIVLSAVGEEVDKVLLLEIGADDCKRCVQAFAHNPAISIANFIHPVRICARLSGCSQAIDDEDTRAGDGD